MYLNPNPNVLFMTFEMNELLPGGELQSRYIVYLSVFLRPMSLLIRINRLTLNVAKFTRFYITPRISLPFLVFRNMTIFFIYTRYN